MIFCVADPLKNALKVSKETQLESVVGSLKLLHVKTRPTLVQLHQALLSFIESQSFPGIPLPDVWGRVFASNRNLRRWKKKRHLENDETGKWNWMLCSQLSSLKFVLYNSIKPERWPIKETQRGYMQRENKLFGSESSSNYANLCSSVRLWSPNLSEALNLHLLGS